MAVAKETEARLTVFRDMVHAFPIFAFAHATPRAAIDEAAAFVRAATGTHRPPRVFLDVARVSNVSVSIANGVDRRVFVGARLAGDDAWRWTEPAVWDDDDDGAFLFGVQGRRAAVVLPAATKGDAAVDVCVAQGSAVLASAPLRVDPSADVTQPITLRLGDASVDLFLALAGDDDHVVPNGTSVAVEAGADDVDLGPVRSRFPPPAPPEAGAELAS